MQSIPKDGVSKMDLNKKLKKELNFYFITSISLVIILIIAVYFYFSEFQNYTNLNFIGITSKFHKQNKYNINTNNCVDQAVNLKKILTKNGYDVGLIELRNKNINEPGHLIDSIIIYIDPTNNTVMNKKQLIEKWIVG